MAAIDFTTALGRLLQDGILRDELAAHPESVVARLELCDRDRAALLALNPTDLEHQARVLLGKRFDGVLRIIPETCRRLGDRAWPLFAGYARRCWPREEPVAAADAFAFCAHLQFELPEAVNRCEWNRLRFARSRNVFSIHVLTRRATRGRPALQILFKRRSCHWKELLFYLKF